MPRKITLYRLCQSDFQIDLSTTKPLRGSFKRIILNYSKAFHILNHRLLVAKSLIMVLTKLLVNLSEHIYFNSGQKVIVNKK